MDSQAMVAAYVAQHPDAHPANNPIMSAAVNAPDYVDRGMWGPYGGKNGTISQVWLDENARMAAGGASELGLMTVIEPPDEQEEDES